MSVTPLQDKWGRYSASQENATGVTASGQMRLCVFDPLPQPMWVKRIRVNGGKSTSTAPTVRNTVYDTDASKNPTTRMGYTNSYSATTLKVDDTTGTTYEQDLEQIDAGPSTSALLIAAGVRPAVGYLATGAGFAHSMKAADDISAQNEQFYDRSGLSQPPPSSIGSYVASVEGHITCALVGEFNEAPVAPNNLVPAGTISDLTPDFSFSHRDNNGTFGTTGGNGVDRGDKMSKARIWVRRVSDQVEFWYRETSADSSERAADSMTRTYAGTALVAGTAYEWQVQTRDDANEWGTLSAWTTFTVSTTGTVTLNGTPTGTLQGVTGTPLTDFQWRWTHAASLSANAVEFRLYDLGVVGPNGTGRVSGSGSLIDTSPTIAVTVASSASPGTLNTQTLTALGFVLEPGKRYGYSARARDTNNVWSAWSPTREFATDDPPSVPTQLSPVSGIKTGAFPLLTCKVTDDDDTNLTGLTASAVITRPDTTTVTVTMVWDATLYLGLGGFKFQTTATEINQVGVYSWKCRSFDGTFYSGGSTSVGSAVYSASSTFEYTTGPVVAIVNPTDGQIVTAHDSPIVWTVTTTQVDRQVIITDMVTGEVREDTGLVTTSVTSYVPTVNAYEDDGSYLVTVIVHDDTAQQGSSQNTFTTQFTQPGAVDNAQIAPVRFHNDPFDTAFRITWAETLLSDDEFAHYRVYRRLAGEDVTKNELLYKASNREDTNFTDYHAPSEVEVIYTVSQRRFEGGHTVEGPGLEVSGTLHFGGAVLVSVQYPESTRVVMRYLTGFTQTGIQNRKVYNPLSGGNPIGVTGKSRYYSYPIVAQVTTETMSGGPTGAALRADLIKLFENGGTFSIRDDTGLKDFVQIEDWSLSRAGVRSNQRFEFSATLRAQRWTEELS